MIVTALAYARCPASISCSDWPPEIPAAALAAPAHTGRLKVVTLPLGDVQARPNFSRYRVELRRCFDYNTAQQQPMLADGPGPAPR